MNPFCILFLAIVAEIIGTTALKASQGFTQLWPSVLAALGYGAAFYLLSLSMKQIPLGIAYAIWSGVGTAATVAISVLILREAIGLPGLIGVGHDYRRRRGSQICFQALMSVTLGISYHEGHEGHEGHEV